MNNNETKNKAELQEIIMKLADETQRHWEATRDILRLETEPEGDTPDRDEHLRGENKYHQKKSRELFDKLIVAEYNIFAETLKREEAVQRAEAQTEDYSRELAKARRELSEAKGRAASKEIVIDCLREEAEANEAALTKARNELTEAYESAAKKQEEIEN